MYCQAPDSRNEHTVFPTDTHVCNIVRVIGFRERIWGRTPTWGEAKAWNKKKAAQKQGGGKFNFLQIIVLSYMADNPHYVAVLQ